MTVDLHAHYPMSVIRGKRRRLHRVRAAASRLRFRNFVRSLLVVVAGLFFNYRSVFSGPRVQIPYMKEGEVGVALSVHYSFFDEFDLHRCPRPGPDYMAALDDQITMVIEHVEEKHPDDAIVVQRPSDLEPARAAGKIALVPCIEGGFHLGADPAQVRTSVNALADRGIAYITLAHLIWRGFATNAPALPMFSDAEYRRRFPQPAEGLSPLGRAAVEAMVERRVLIDVAHMSSRSLEDTFSLLDELDPDGSVPVLATHAGFRFGEQEYMLDAAALKKIAARGGVVGLIFAQHQIYDGPPPVRDGRPPGWRQRRGIRLRRRARIEDSVEALRSHIDAIRDATGSHEHTAIGTDFDGFIKPTLAGFEDMRAMADLREALHREYPDDAEAILSGNAMRLLGEHWGGAPPS